MSNQTTILLDDIGAFTQAVWLVDNEVVDYQLEPKIVEHRIDDVYVGQVARVVTSLDAAFINIGEQRSAFLPISSAQLYVGQKLFVQLKRFATESKAARVSTDITLVGKAIIFLPFGADVVVSNRVTNKHRKRELRHLLQNYLAHNNLTGGFIVRSGAELIPEDEILLEAQQLQDDWQERVTQSGQNQKPHKMYKAPSLVQRVLLLAQSENTRCVVAALQSDQWAANYGVSDMTHCQLHQSQQSLFESWGVAKLLSSLTQREVTLATGGSVVFDHSEAMTTVDVNSGSVATGSDEANFLNTNLEACAVIAQQLKLRNVGGLVVIDFINMASEQHQQRILTTLSAALAGDTLTDRRIEFSKFGLVELQRQRRGTNLSDLLFAQCPNCNGAARIPTPLFVAHQIVQEVLVNARQLSVKAYTVRAANAVLEQLRTTLASELQQICREFDCELTLSEQTRAVEADYAIVLAQ